MPAHTSYAAVTIARITDATAFGKAVLALTGTNDSLLLTNGAGAPQVMDFNLAMDTISGAQVQTGVTNPVNSVTLGNGLVVAIT